MKYSALAILLTLLWAAITANFNGANLLLGAILAGIFLFLLRGAVGAPSELRRVGPILMLCWTFAWELLFSAIRVGLLVLTPGLGGRLRPAIVAVPLTVKSDLEITLLANLITLTPGTLSLDVSDDRSMLYVHVLMLDDRAALLEGIASGFERRIKAVFA